jgi:hypothetical protein
VKMDGAYIRGVGDLSSPSEIQVASGAYDAAVAFLNASESDTLARVGRVSQLIEGYESPYGLELLSTVHWAAYESPETVEVDEVVRRVAAWNDRKRQIMPASEIVGALDRLAGQRWVH